jgi:hypothetical protein
MNALAPMAVASTPFGVGLRLFELAGDAYEPELRSRDMLMVAPCERFTYDTDYLVDFGHGEHPIRAASCFNGQVEVWKPNPFYSRYRISREEFNQAVRAIVVAEVKLRDERRIRQARSERVSA